MPLAWECFHRAMYVLTGSDPQRERLLRVYRNNLKCLDGKDVPAEIRDDFVRLSTSLERETVESLNGSQLLDEWEVAAAINALIRMYDVLARYEPIRCVQPERE